MNPIDAVRLALEARAMEPDELRALAERCVATGEADVAALARAFARLGEVEASGATPRKKVDNQMSQAHGCA